MGSLQAYEGRNCRNHHSVFIVMGILSSYQGRSFGKKLLEELLSWAKERNIHRLELTVVTENIPALTLYQKMGFTVEGVKKDSLYVAGEYLDEYYMGRIL